jgi:hypothetical protein
MVVGLVDVASDALLDSPGRLFWPIVIESRHTCPTPVTSAPSFCSPRRLISLTPSLVSCVGVRARPTGLHFTTTYLLLLLLLLPQIPSCNSCNPLSTLPVVDLLPGIHIHTPRNTSGWLTVDHPSHRHIDLIRFSDQTFSVCPTLTPNLQPTPNTPSSLRHVDVSHFARRHVRPQSETRHRYEAGRVPLEPRHLTTNKQIRIKHHKHMESEQQLTSTYAQRSNNP